MISPRSGNLGRWITLAILAAFACIAGPSRAQPFGFGSSAALNSNASTDSGDDIEPRVTTDGSGNWLAVWESADTLGATVGSDDDIFVAVSTNNGAT